jgi:hypothetical protein
VKPEKILAEIEEKIPEKGYSAVKLMFWRLVEEIKKDPGLAEKYAGRIGRIDQGIFKEKAAFTVPASMGNFLAFLGISASFGILLGGASGKGLFPLAFSLSAAFLLSSTIHPLAHLIVGRASGMRFTFYFLNGPLKIEPTIKVDYGTYLKASPGQRVAMHLAGPAATTLSPLALLGAAYLLGYPAGALYALAAFSVLFLFTEVIPMFLLRAGFIEFCGMNLRKTDTYRAMREKGLT